MPMAAKPHQRQARQLDYFLHALSSELRTLRYSEHPICFSLYSNAL